MADNVAEPPFQVKDAIGGNEMVWLAAMTLNVCVMLVGTS